MASVLSRLRRPPTKTRGLTLDDAVKLYFQGNTYATQMTSMTGVAVEPIDVNLGSYISRIHKQNSIAATAVTRRALLISQLEFMWLNDASGRSFTTGGLAPLQQPRRDLTASALLTTGEVDASYAGNAYIYNRDRDPRNRKSGLHILRPDLTDVMIGSDDDPDRASVQLDGETVGYVYYPDGRGARGTVLTLDMVAHWMPHPDPLARWRGESWVTAAVRDILSDEQVTAYVEKFFENAATANLAYTAPPTLTNPTQFKEWVDEIEKSHAGASNAWRNLYLGAGADVSVIGSNIAEVALKDLRGELESRLAARSMVPATILGVPSSAVSGGSSLNAGNYLQTRRTWADTWFTPYVTSLTQALQRILDVPDGPVNLTYDPSKVQFLQEDEKDAADIQSTEAQTIAALIREGFTAGSAVDAVANNDWSLLVHSGALSVQLQVPGENGSALEASTNGQDA